MDKELEHALAQQALAESRRNLALAESLPLNESRRNPKQVPGVQPAGQTAGHFLSANLRQTAPEKKGGKAGCAGDAWRPAAQKRTFATR